MASLTIEDIPQPDCAPDAPHPRETVRLLGQEAAEASFLDAFTSARMHHAWLITGPRGVGKATLAWRIAKFLLSQPQDDGPQDSMFGAPPVPTTLDADENHPAVRRSQSLGEPRLFLCRRPWDDKAKRLKKDITVDEVRKLKSFFALSAADGGWRVAIVDDMDQMNTSAANALLKVLEEPPEKTILLLISHQPARLLPTIRSRCRNLKCVSLSPELQAAALQQAGYENTGDAATTELSGGSVGAALRLAQADGASRYAALVALASTAPGLDRSAASSIAEKCVGAANAETYDITVNLIDLLLNRLARFGALQPGNWSEAAPNEAQTLAKLAPHAHAARKWADLAQELSARVGHARAVNLDPSGVILDMLLKLDDAARP
ncbi:DNA polymerase III subunit delta' [Amylibacter sp.]|jgi:DNA polymerase III subunit delta'|nr:DNA polymerase III subunit delta' [Amylibacter sp.]